MLSNYIQFSVDAFNLSSSKLLHANCLFLFAASHWQFIRICSYFICESCSPIVKHLWPRAGRETLNLEVACSKPIRTKVQKR